MQLMVCHPFGLGRTFLFYAFHWKEETVTSFMQLELGMLNKFLQGQILLKAYKLLSHKSIVVFQNRHSTTLDYWFM